jgi:hypothetical protein
MIQHAELGKSNNNYSDLLINENLILRQNVQDLESQLHSAYMRIAELIQNQEKRKLKVG